MKALQNMASWIAWDILGALALFLRALSIQPLEMKSLTTEILSADDPESLLRAEALLRGGEVVALPTETVYGLGANGLDAEAVLKIFEAKGRPGDNPLILHVVGIEQALALWEATDEQIRLARRLADAFWPGPLSIVLPAASVVPGETTAGLDSVAVRAPANAVMQELLRRCPFPLAAPSANESGRPSATSAEHVLATLSGKIAAVVDGGSTELGLESTVLDIRGETPQILRPGMISKVELEAVIGEVGRAGESVDLPSPGVRHRHYQPAGMRVLLLDAKGIEARWDEEAAVMCQAQTAARLGSRSGPLVVMPDDARAFAAQLYRAFYELEKSAAKLLLVEKVPGSPEWGAIRDRLNRAAEG